ncbi:MAG: hypothetical protein EXQ49_11795 [Acidobacteria bacterium]|nr:hypothetical protein [Acidobacteriota bacterium]
MFRGHQRRNDLAQQLADLEAEVASAIETVAAGNAAGSVEDPLETITIAPKRGGIHVQVVAILWTTR